MPQSHTPDSHTSGDFFVDGTPRWMTGSIQALRVRIARMVDEEILSQNPLWTMFEETVPVS